MASSSREPGRGDGFHLLDWEVRPSLNRLRRGDTEVRIEPKWMDVLVFLAGRSGEVVSKEEIADEVWADVFTTEAVVTRAIAGLRRALADTARNSTFIETIPKRGYRLLVPPVSTAGTQPAPSPRSREVAVAPATRGAGQWARGDGFFGRSEEIAEILRGPRNGLWVVGSRAVGKTSLLKHLEHLTAAPDEAHYFPLFWDLQGSDDPDLLNDDFLEALEEVEDRLAAVGVPIGEVAADDLFQSLGRLRRALRARGRSLLLLWDEVEELIELHRKSPVLLRKLRRALQSREGVRTVLASSSRLWKLAEQRDDTSPFLHGFAPPLYLGPLDDGAARRLAVQGWPPEGAGEEEGVVAEILRRSGNHPSLLQLLSSRYAELGNLDAATESVVADPTVELFLSTDLDLLSDFERTVLERAAAEPSGVSTDELFEGASAMDGRASLLHLERLGLLGRAIDGRQAVASEIFRLWLCGRRGSAAAD